MDFSLATDGLVAEREQGITIDVAHIYFSTPNRSYIIADTPGHIEYTRNMVTGASTAQASIILVDARNGVIEQTIRHFNINNLLRVKHLLVAVNKMDLVDYAQEKFTTIVNEIRALQNQSPYTDQIITFIPISALHGDNVVNTSTHMDWYTGSTLLHALEHIQPQEIDPNTPARFPVQTVIRPKTTSHPDYRGYAGKLYGNSMRVGDRVMVLPSKTQSVIKAIDFFTAQFDQATPGSSFNMILQDNIDISRGDLITKVNEVPSSGKEIHALVCWMDKDPLKTGSKYIIQNGVKKVLSKTMRISEIQNQQDTHLADSSALKLNQIGLVHLKLNTELFYDTYAENTETGAFILIHPHEKTTAGVGFIQ